MTRSIRTALLGISIASALCAAALAAPNPPIGPVQNIDLYNTVSPPAAVITNSARTPATVTGVPIANTQWSGVTCVSLATASSGSPTEVFSIEGQDAATGAWYQIGTTGTITYYPGGTIAPNTLTVRPGVATSSLSSGNVAQSAALPRVWRLKDVVAAGTGAAGPALTNKIGCNYLK